MDKPKETPEQRRERIRLDKTMKTKVVPDKKKYNRKRAKQNKDWPAFVFKVNSPHTRNAAYVF